MSSHLEGSHLEQFIATVARLRAPDGCPWDREQTHKTLARYLLEEAYEVLEAIHEGDPEKLKEELGDLLLQIVLNAQVAADDGKFTIDDVAQGINAKMIRRHPHVFADSQVNDARGVVTQWQQLKEEEKKAKGDEKKSALSGIPRTMPALMQALKVSEKAVNQGFEWNNEADVWDKLESEIVEMKEAISSPLMTQPAKHSQAKEEIALEFGDMLFCMVNLARWHALDPEECLLMTINKFRDRFEWMEEHAPSPLKEQSADELNELWEKAKASLKK
jgi:MazG family protein